MYKRTNINFNEEDRQELIKLLKPRGVNVSWMVRYLIAEYLKTQGRKPVVTINENSVVFADSAGTERTLVRDE